MRRYLYPFLLVFAFLFAQVGYTAHLATHLAAPVQQKHGHTSDAPCELCISFAQLGGTPMAFTFVQLPIVAAVQDWFLAPPERVQPLYRIHATARAPPGSLV
jgi:hypothetical protein